jgi:hypothetical protein
MAGVPPMVGSSQPVQEGPPAVLSPGGPSSCSIAPIQSPRHPRTRTAANVRGAPVLVVYYPSRPGRSVFGLQWTGMMVMLHGQPGRLPACYVLFLPAPLYLGRRLSTTLLSGLFRALRCARMAQDGCEG